MSFACRCNKNSTKRVYHLPFQICVLLWFCQQIIDWIEFLFSCFIQQSWKVALVMVWNGKKLVYLLVSGAICHDADLEFGFAGMQILAVSALIFECFDYCNTISGAVVAYHSLTGYLHLFSSITWSTVAYHEAAGSEAGREDECNTGKRNYSLSVK